LGGAGKDVAGCAPEHLAGVLADRDHLVVRGGVGDDRRLVEHNAAILDIHQHIGGSEIDAHVLGEAHGSKQACFPTTSAASATPALIDVYDGGRSAS
jgi:hypothetical protein